MLHTIPQLTDIAKEIAPRLREGAVLDDILAEFPLYSERTLEDAIVVAGFGGLIR